MNIKTNNQPRQPMSGLTLDLFVGDKQAAKIRKQFDYLTDTEFEDQSFIMYKGYVYAMSDFMRIEQDSTGDSETPDHPGGDWVREHLAKLEELRTQTFSPLAQTITF